MVGFEGVGRTLSCTHRERLVGFIPPNPDPRRYHGFTRTLFSGIRSISQRHTQ